MLSVPSVISHNELTQAELQELHCLPLAFGMVFFLLAYSSTLKLEVIYSSETSVDFQRTAWRYILEELFITIAVRTSNPTCR
jgi:hypothetical protein